MRQSKSGILKWSTEKFLRYFWWESWSRSFWFEINGWQFYLENQKEQHGLGRVSHPLLGLTRSVQLSDIEYGTCLKTFGIYLRIMENLEITVMETRTWQYRTQAGYKESYDFTHWRSLIVCFGTKSDENGAAMTMLRKYFLHQLKKIIKEGKTVLRENNEKQVCVSSAQKRGFWAPRWRMLRRFFVFCLPN